MKRIPPSAFKDYKVAELTDEEAAKLVRLVKMSSDQNGILMMKTLRNSIIRALFGRRLKQPNYKKPQYQWLYCKTSSSPVTAR